MLRIVRTSTRSLPRRLYYSSATTPLVISPTDYTRLSGPVIPVDVSWHMPGSGRDPSVEFFKGKRIPRARFLGLDKAASSHPLNLPHMMPSEALFSQTCRSLGIRKDSHVVLYDTIGVFSSPRALFMFKAFGHEKASVLNGGLHLWDTQGFPIEDGDYSLDIRPSDYPEPTLNASSLRTYEQIRENAEHPLSTSDSVELVLDARAAPRYHGTAPEPRPGLPSGHIPHSLSLPFNALLESHTSGPSTFTTIREPDDLRKVIVDILGSDEVLQPNAKRRIVNTCGSGMTAAIIWLALQRLGVDSALYDESWMGYAGRPESKIVTDK